MPLGGTEGRAPPRLIRKNVIKTQVNEAGVAPLEYCAKTKASGGDEHWKSRGNVSREPKRTRSLARGQTVY